MAEMTDWQSIPLADLLPHAPPMVLLDRVVAYQQQSLEAEVTIMQNSMFFERALNGVPAWVCIEYMAQAVAALGGLHARAQQQSPRSGFLLGTRRLLLHAKVLHAGQTYRVLVQKVFHDETGLANFACRLLLAEQLCAEAGINVFVPPGSQPEAGTTVEGVNKP